MYNILVSIIFPITSSACGMLFILSLATIHHIIYQEELEKRFYTITPYPLNQTIFSR